MNDGSFRIVRSESHTIARNELVIDSFWISIYSRAVRAGINYPGSEDGGRRGGIKLISSARKTRRPRPCQ